MKIFACFLLVALLLEITLGQSQEEICDCERLADEKEAVCQANCSPGAEPEVSQELKDILAMCCPICCSEYVQ